MIYGGSVGNATYQLARAQGAAKVISTAGSAAKTAHARKLGFLGEIYERSKNPLVIQLLVIAAVSLWMGDARAASVSSGRIGSRKAE